MAEIGLMEYGKPFGVQRFLKRAPVTPQELWHKAEIEPAPSTARSRPLCI